MIYTSFVEKLRKYKELGGRFEVMNDGSDVIMSDKQ